MPVEIVQDGKTYEWTDYQSPRKGDVFLTDDGSLSVCKGDWGSGERSVFRPIFRLKPVRHVFGGVVFEEGETRASEPGDWYLDNGLAPQYATSHCGKRLILRPVAIEGQE